MKTFPKKKSLTFGEFVAVVYATCGKRQARELIRRAVNAHMIVFPKQQRFEFV